MRTPTRMIAITAASLVFGTALAGNVRLDPLNQWPGWRGPLGTGEAPRASPPLTWSESTNVRWKTALPGLGHSTPVVWGNRIFLTSAIPAGKAVAKRTEPAAGAHNNVAALSQHKFLVIAIDRATGKIAWQRTVHTEQPHESTHETGSWASNSPVTDGERVFAFFGSRGLYALDFDGKVLWQKDIGDMRIMHGHGEGSSPALHDDTLVVNWDHEAGSFLVALESRTGKQKWKVARDEKTSWSSPVVVTTAGKTQVITAATTRIRSYDLATGDEIWQCGGLSGNVVATPVAAEGMVYAGSSYDIRAMLAIRLEGARGDITDTDAVIWKLDRQTPYVPSPLLYGTTLYFLRHNQGLLTALDAKTGRLMFGPERLPDISNVYASLVGAADRVYVVSREGQTAVVAHGPKFAVLAVNQLDDSFSASPVVVGGDLYLRGRSHLYCLAEERHQEAAKD